MWHLSLKTQRENTRDRQKHRSRTLTTQTRLFLIVKVFQIKTINSRPTEGRFNAIFLFIISSYMSRLYASDAALTLHL